MPEHNLREVDNKDSERAVEFADDSELESVEPIEHWKILIVDDDQEVHRVTHLALSGLTFQGKAIQFVSAYSGNAAIDIIENDPGIALILLDVVMEEDNAGLEVVRRIRNDLRNRNVRIILRTGQAGQAPARDVVLNYDINDYKDKTDLTAQHLLTTVVSCLRAYSHISEIDENRRRIAELYENLKKSYERSETLLREQTEQTISFAKCVPKQFLECLQIENYRDIRPELARNIHLTVIFSDIRNFTHISESMTPEQVFKFLNAYFAIMSEAISYHSGFIDKFLGDGIMALFRQSADDALDAAIKMQRNLREFNLARRHNGEADIEIGVGVNTGDLVLGTIGSENRVDSTVVGDAVNIASRIESLTKVYAAGILISEYTYNALCDTTKYKIREVDIVRVYGRVRGFKIYEVYDGDDKDLCCRKDQQLEIFTRGLRCYKEQRWEEAIDCMSKGLIICPPDRIASMYLQRCQEFLKSPPPPDWDGSTNYMEK